jgi:hypothetical protein
MLLHPQKALKPLCAEIDPLYILYIKHVACLKLLYYVYIVCRALTVYTALNHLEAKE